MKTGRLEAFTDGVVAILITIMVLELREPEGASWHDLRHVMPTVLIYLLSFVYIGIYWNNHHHMLQLTERIDGRVLWANLALLFWLSLIPAATKWLGQTGFETVPTAIYGIVLFVCGVSYTVLAIAITRCDQANARLAEAMGNDRKGKVSLALYALGIALAFVNHWLGLAVLTGVALIWFIPDRRVERVLESR